MTGVDDLMMEITPEVLLKAYSCGIFPMAESADDPGIFWVEPRMRGIIPLEAFHVPRRLARSYRQGIYDIRIDADFEQTIYLCSEEFGSRRETWINSRIVDLYTQLHMMGHCHSVECWKSGELVGGLYGLQIGAAFFGESMFSRARDASKIALVHLVERMRAGNFTLLDTQFSNSHLVQFGAIEIPKKDYEKRLKDALEFDADFFALDAKGKK